jgi:hypothetical protein
MSRALSSLELSTVAALWLRKKPTLAPELRDSFCLHLIQELTICPDPQSGETPLEPLKVQTTRLFPRGVRCVWRGAGAAGYRGHYWTVIGRRDRQIATIRLKTSTISSTRSETVRRIIGFSMRGSNSSFTAKSCTCITVTFLAWIISWSVDGTIMQICVIWTYYPPPPKKTELLFGTYLV